MRGYSSLICYLEDLNDRLGKQEATGGDGMTSQIDIKRKELEDKLAKIKLVKADTIQIGLVKRETQRNTQTYLEGFNLGVELAQKEFIKDMVFMLSKYFQSTSRQSFIQMRGNLSYQEFCKECYEYLQSLGVKE